MPAARAEARRRRRVKVFGQTFFKKFAVGKAEPYGLKSNARRCKRKTRETGGPGPQWGPIRTGLRCHFGRCWASATGRQHPRRQPRPALKGAGVCGGRLASGPRLSSVETSKVFAQAFFKRLAERETASRDPKGVARTVGPAFPYTKKGGTDVPLLGQHKSRCPRA